MFFLHINNKGGGNTVQNITPKEEQTINHYTSCEDQSQNDGKKGKRVGTTYELVNGEIIYVAEYTSPLYACSLQPMIVCNFLR